MRVRFPSPAHDERKERPERRAQTKHRHADAAHARRVCEFAFLDAAIQSIFDASNT
jgi:hypothetical protein